MARKYALIGDMVDSRGAGGHRGIHRQLARILADVNRRFAAALWAPLGLTKGVDEMSAALLDLTPAYDLVCHVNLLIHPLRFRFSVGWGEVFSLTPDRKPGALDGDAYHAAAAGLERARRERLPLAFTGHPAAFTLRLSTVESLAHLDGTLRAEWSPAEVAIARAIQDRPNATQTDLARRSRRTQQAVSRATVRGHFKALARANASIRELLADVHSAATP